MTSNDPKLSVLVIEDDEGLNQLICKQLIRSGLEASGVFRGDEAIKALQDNPYQFLIVDFGLPDMSGSDLIHELKSLNFHPPFIMATGRGDEKVAVDTMKLGARDYLIKDHNFLNIIAKVVKRELSDYEIENRLQTVEEEYGSLAAFNQNVLDTITDIIVEVDENKIYRWMNKSALQFFGEDAIGCEAKEYFVGDQDTYDRVDPIFKGEQDTVYVESTQRRRDGEARILGWWCKAVKDELGNITGAISSAKDITYLKHAEGMLEHDLKLRTGNAELASLILKPDVTVEQVTEDVLRRALDIIPAQHGYVGEVDPDNGDLIIHTFTKMMDKECQVDDEHKQIKFPPDENGNYNGIWGNSLNTKEAFFTNDPDNHHKSSGTPNGHIHIDNFMSVPVLLDGDVVGQISLANIVGGFNHIHIADVRTLAHYFALSIRQVRAKKQLEDRESYFRSMMNQLYEDILVINRDYEITDINNTFLRTAGLHRTDVVGKKCFELTHGYNVPCEEMGEDCELKRVFASGDYAECQHEHINKNGKKKWVNILLSPQKNDAGEVVNVIEAVRDITDLKNAQQRVIETSEFRRTLLNTIPLPVYYKSIDGKYVSINTAAEKFMGIPEDQIIGKTVDELFPKELANLFRKQDQDMQEGDGRQRYEAKTPRSDGNLRDVIFDRAIVYNDEGKPIGIIGIVTDITETKNTQIELQEQKTFFEQMFMQSTVSTQILDKDGWCEKINAELSKLFGVRPEDIEGRKYNIFEDGAIIESGVDKYLRKVFDEKEPVEWEVNFDIGLASESTGVKVTKPVKRWFTNRAYPILNESGELVNVIVQHQDVSDKKMAEEAIKENERRLKVLFSNLPGVAFRCPHVKGWPMEYVSPGCEDLTGFTVEELSTRAYPEFGDLVHPDDVEKVWSSVTKATEKDKKYTLEYRIIHKSGEIKWVWEQGLKAGEDEDGIPYLEGIISDISEIRKAEEALRVSEELFRSMIEQSADGIYLLYDGKFEIINKKFTEFTGLNLDEVNADDFNFMQLVAEDHRPMIAERQRLMQEGKTLSPTYEFRAVRKDGEEIQVEASVAYLKYKDGIATLGIIRDVSDRKSLESQLHQAQKMESIGRLAGGVAHDFNNLITVITGHADLALNTLDEMDPLRDDLNEILKASDKAGGLTRQLLAVSRKQSLNPKIMNLNAVIEELKKMLTRVIGEDVSLNYSLSNDLWNIKADHGQISQIIINLVVNARDAMPDGGLITVETQNLVLDEEYAASHSIGLTGEHVMLAISDTGIGMSDEIKKQIFEPFFTTKGEGKGTGLGLSTVYGIVKQSNGNVWVYSEQGEGTTFKIYFPMIAEKAEVLILSDSLKELPSGDETILLVEDDNAVRKLASTTLKRLGYKVIEAENGGAALLICKDSELRIDLVVTDIVMPNMKGTVLIETLLDILPPFKVLFMSGYPSNAIAQMGILQPDVPYLQKPFRPIDLAIRVRMVLEAKPS